jgi:hypothetical protein
MAMLFPGAFWLLGSRVAFLGMERMFPGTPALFLGTFWLLGKGPSFLGTLRWFLGIVLGECRLAAGTHVRSPKAKQSHLTELSFALVVSINSRAEPLLSCSKMMRSSSASLLKHNLLRSGRNAVGLRGRSGLDFQ